MAARRKTAILLPLALLLANFLNMVGIVVLPKIIDPSQFALFSLASSSGFSSSLSSTNGIALR